MSEAVNPYESPQIAAISNSQASVGAANESPETRIAALEARVAQLEQRLAKSWFLSPHIYRQVLAVWGYFMLGYVVFLTIVFAIALLASLLGSRF